MERARKRYKKAKANSHEDVTKEEFQEEIQYILRNLYEEFIEPDDDTKADRRKRGDSEEKLTRDKSDAITLFHKIAKDADIVHDPPANAAGEQDAEMLRGWRAMLYREQQARADSDENESVAGESVYGGSAQDSESDEAGEAGPAQDSESNKGEAYREARLLELFGNDSPSSSSSSPSPLNTGFLQARDSSRSPPPLNTEGYKRDYDPLLKTPKPRKEGPDQGRGRVFTSEPDIVLSAPSDTTSSKRDDRKKGKRKARDPEVNSADDGKDDFLVKIPNQKGITKTRDNGNRCPLVETPGKAPRKKAPDLKKRYRSSAANTTSSKKDGKRKEKRKARDFGLMSAADEAQHPTFPNLWSYEKSSKSEESYLERLESLEDENIASLAEQQLPQLTQLPLDRQHPYSERTTEELIRIICSSCLCIRCKMLIDGKNLQMSEVALQRSIRGEFKEHPDAFQRCINFFTLVRGMQCEIEFVYLPQKVECLKKSYELSQKRGFDFKENIFSVTAFSHEKAQEVSELLTLLQFPLVYNYTMDHVGLTRVESHQEREARKKHVDDLNAHKCVSFSNVIIDRADIDLVYDQRKTENTYPSIKYNPGIFEKTFKLYHHGIFLKVKSGGKSALETALTFSPADFRKLVQWLHDNENQKSEMYRGRNPGKRSKVNETDLLQTFLSMHL